jgi:LPS export ABC transporter protein LptC
MAVRSPGLLLTRRQVRSGLAVVLLMALAGLAVQLGRSQWQQHLRGLRNRELDFLPAVAQRIQNFRRVKMEGGRKAWEVAAREAQYTEEDSQVAIEAPEVSFYLKGDQGVVSIRGDQGKILLDGREMDRVELSGAIEIRFNDYLIRTDRAVYERASDTVVSPDAVTISGRGLLLTGRGMTVEMEEQRLRLEGKVETVLRQAEEGAGAGAL